MSNKLFFTYLGWLVMSLTGLYACPSYGQQVIPDGTVGTSVETTVSDEGSFVVTGGIQQQTTLFHSFQEFSPAAADVLFQLSDPQRSVEFVIGRVTGVEASFIDSQLQLTGGNTPDLFLINPNGIMFGGNASLLLPGSFFATTAESILFENELSFSSREPAAMPLLSVSVPVGLQFGAVANPITVDGSNLEVIPGESLGFLGGELTFANSSLYAPEGKLVLGSVAEGSQLSLAPDTLLLDYANVADFRDITLNQGTFANVSGNGGGIFQLQGRTIRLLEDSLLEASNNGDADGGLVSVRASERVELLGDYERFSSAIYVDVYGSGQGNRLLIETDQLVLGQSAFITTETFDQGGSGGMTINAKDVLLFGNPDGDGVPTVISSRTYGPGLGGDVDLTADRVIGEDWLAIAVDTVDQGTGGNLTLNVGQLTLKDGAQVGTGTFAQGDSGNFTLIATEQVDVQGFSVDANGVFSSGLFSSAEPNSTGNAGTLSITTPRLRVVQGGKIAVNTVGDGDGGNITIRAGEIDVADPIVDFTGAVSGLVANAVNGSTGNGGSLDIQANRLNVYNGGQITASTDGAGNAGTVMISADEIAVFGQSSDGTFSSGIMSGARTPADAGSVNLLGGQISVGDGASISVNSLSGGDAGNLTITAETLYLNAGTLQAKVMGGASGNLDINLSELLLLRQNSQIVTSATGLATGGNITIHTPVLVGLENSDIIANAIAGDGGNVSITTQGLLGLAFRPRLSADSDITASSQFGLNGMVEINNFGVDFDIGLTELPTGLVESGKHIVQGCGVDSHNELVVTGRGGVPGAAGTALSPNAVWLDTRAPGLHTASMQAAQSAPVVPLLEEAVGWHMNAAGDIELLTAAASMPTPAICLHNSSDG